MTKEYAKLLINDIKRCRDVTIYHLPKIVEQTIEPVEMACISIIDGKLKYTVKFENDMMLYRGLII